MTAPDEPSLPAGCTTSLFSVRGRPPDGTGHYRKTGLGSVVVSGIVSDYHGSTIIEAGTLRFENASHVANSSFINSTGDALGVDTGIYSNAALLAKIDAADTGGLMLTPTEAAANLDFTAGPLANAAHMSVAWPEAGIIYTGTITPAAKALTGSVAAAAC